MKRRLQRKWHVFYKVCGRWALETLQRCPPLLQPWMPLWTRWYLWAECLIMWSKSKGSSVCHEGRFTPHQTKKKKKKNAVWKTNWFYFFFFLSSCWYWKTFVLGVHSSHINTLFFKRKKHRYRYKKSIYVLWSSRDFNITKGFYMF